VVDQTPNSSTEVIAQVARAIQRAVRWLKEYSQDLTDSRDIAITASALITAERNPHSHDVQRLVTLLVRRQAENGSWNDELWDTTWAMKALVDAGYDSDAPALQAAFEFLKSTQDSVSGTWYEEPFETMLVLDLIVRVAPGKLAVFSDRPFRWIASLQKSDGSVIGTRYTGMAASLFRLARSVGLHEAEEVANKAINSIRDSLEDKPIWTDAAWSNFYPLRALLDGGRGLDDPIVAKAVHWFLTVQDSDGKWMQVSRVHDTAMAVIVLSALLSTPLIDVSNPRIGVLNVIKENGTIRVSFLSPEAGAITPAEKMKISDQVRAELSQNQQLIAAAMGRLRSKTRGIQTVVPSESINVELERSGRYAYGHLLPGRIQSLLEASPSDHLRLELDERLIDLPWEIAHDGSDFLCLKYAIGRRLVSDQNFVPPRREPRSAENTRVLIVADPTRDLPAARQEGEDVAALLRDRCGMRVDEYTEASMSKRDFLLSVQDYQIVHFAGHASCDPMSPDENCLVFSDGEIQAFEIARFITNRSPTIVFLNACWSAEELRDSDAYSPMMRGLGKTFLFAGVTAFLGYLIPVPDDSATRFALSFYEALSQGQTIGEASRRARIHSRNLTNPNDLTWSSALLYGDPAARVIAAPTTH
jgi:CHAT domain-containing protein